MKEKKIRNLVVWTVICLAFWPMPTSCLSIGRIGSFSKVKPITFDVPKPPTRSDLGFGSGNFRSPMVLAPFVVPRVIPDVPDVDNHFRPKFDDGVDVDSPFGRRSRPVSPWDSPFDLDDLDFDMTADFFRNSTIWKFRQLNSFPEIHLKDDTSNEEDVFRMIGEVKQADFDRDNSAINLGVKSQTTMSLGGLLVICLCSLMFGLY